jgi:hypothetical protein
VIALCRKFRVDDTLHTGFYFLTFDSEAQWESAKEHRKVVIANKGLDYAEGAIFMFVHVRAREFHLDGFGRSSHAIKSCKDMEVELHFAELRSSQLGPDKLWKCAESEEAQGLAMKTAGKFTEGHCWELCTGLFGSNYSEASGRKVTESYVGWVGHMFSKATVIFTENLQPEPLHLLTPCEVQPLTREDMEGPYPCIYNRSIGSASTPWSYAHRNETDSA